MISANEITKGTRIELEGDIWEIVDVFRQKIAQRQAHVKVKIKNLRTGQTIEKTFVSDEIFKEPNLDTRFAKFIYKDSDDYVFLDETSYEEIKVRDDIVGEKWKWISDGVTVKFLFKDGIPLTFDLPKVVELEVIETDPGIKGDTESGGSKPAKLITGVVIQVPLHIKPGDTIKVDTEREEYVARV